MITKQLLINSNIANKVTLLCVVFLVLLFANTANAKDYMVEVLVFENINSGIATESQAYEAPRKMKSGSTAWAISPTMLNTEADSIIESPDYELKHHYSWGIESLPYEDSANYTIVESESRGYIKVYADQLLFTNIDLDFKGFRMKEKRRLKLNEKHFFDHPKFGLLMQVSRLPKEPVDEFEEETEQ